MSSYLPLHFLNFVTCFSFRYSKWLIPGSRGDPQLFWYYLPIFPFFFFLELFVLLRISVNWIVSLVFHLRWIWSERIYHFPIYDREGAFESFSRFSFWFRASWKDMLKSGFEFSKENHRYLYYLPSLIWRDFWSVLEWQWLYQGYIFFLILAWYHGQINFPMYTI